MRYFFYIYSLTRGILLFAVAIAFIHVYLGTIFVVSGLSMSPILQSGDLLWVNKLAYLAAKPQRGDIVILKYPGDPEHRKFVKRIIGLPGEIIEIKHGRVNVNGDFLTESYLDSDIPTDPDLSLKLKSDEYFTVGDNRFNSSDSRVFGATPERFLIGRAKARLWPLGQIGYFPAVFY